MTGNTPLEVPAMPGNEGGPVFLEPWHAEVFSLAVALHRQEAFAWSEWVEHFSGILREVPAEKDESVEAAYYRRWLLALESLVARKCLASVEEMARRKEAWRQAYLRTPHGQPVALKSEPGVIAPHRQQPLARGHAGDDHEGAARPGPVAVSPSRSGDEARFSF
jgi:nitrile hydratase accessory protein